MSLVNKSRQIKKIIHSLPAKYNHGLAESACLSGGFQQPIEMKESKLKEISMRLTKQHNDLEADWESSYDQENGLFVTRKIRGVFESLSLGKGIFSSSDSRRLNNLAEENDLQDFKKSIKDIKNLKENLDPTKELKEEINSIKETVTFTDKEIADINSKIKKD